MIVRESNDYYSVAKQHDHAILSGDIASHFKDDTFIDSTYRDDVLLAIREHDRGWIRLDETPVWNDREHVPFSFIDYPMHAKLPHYTIGINEVEEMSSYAALLCSLHYTSFTPIRNSSHPDCIAYMKHEADRQRRMLKKLNLQADRDGDLISHHLRLLQLCDELSLYVCLNRPGATKIEEHPWYKEAFDTTIQDQSLTAKWMNEHKIWLHPFPFKGDFKVSIPMKHVSKEMRTQLGIEKAYRETGFEMQEVTFVD